MFMDHGEGCGQRVRVTPAQAQYVRSALTACSRLCALKARDLRTQQWRLDIGVPGLSESAAHTNAMESAELSTLGQRGGKRPTHGRTTISFCAV